MKAQLRYLLGFLGVNLLSHHLYCPVPEGVEQPWLYTAAVVSNLKIIEDLAKISDALGLKEYRTFKREAIDVLSGLMSFFSEDVEGVSVTREIFHDIPVRVFRPSHLPAARLGHRPGVVYLHDASFTADSTAPYDNLLRRLAADLDVVVVGVDYRLGPQHPRPVVLDDCMKVARYVFVEADSVGVDRRRIGVMGDGVGASLAAALSIAFRDIPGAPQFSYMVLMYPWLQALDFNTPSMQQNEIYAVPDMTRRGLAGLTLTYLNASLEHITALLNNNHTHRASVTYFGRHVQTLLLPEEALTRGYTPMPIIDSCDEAATQEVEGEVLDGYNFPLMVESVAGLPPTLIASMEYDTVRDDGLWFMRRLRSEGQAVRLYHDYKGWHGSAVFIGTFLQFDVAERLYNEIVKYVTVLS